MDQPPVVYVQQQQGSGCGRVLFWLMIVFVALPTLCCLGQVLLGLSYPGK